MLNNELAHIEDGQRNYGSVLCTHQLEEKVIIVRVVGQVGVVIEGHGDVPWEKGCARIKTSEPLDFCACSRDFNKPSAEEMITVVSARSSSVSTEHLKAPRRSGLKDPWTCPPRR